MTDTGMTVAGLRDAVRGLSVPVAGLADSRLVEEIVAWEEFRRVVEARAVALAAEVAERSRFELGNDGLSSRLGYGRADGMLEELLHVTMRDARRRIRLGTQLAARAALTGGALPSLYPHVADAVTAGTIGLDAAELIVRGLASVAPRAVPDDLDAAEAALVGSAVGTAPDVLLVEITAWTTAIDPDGVEPAEDVPRDRRDFTIGREMPDGMSAIRGRVPNEEAALLRETLWNARNRFRSDEIAAPVHPDTDDPRTRGQRDFDTLFALISAGLHVESDRAPGTKQTVTVVHTTVGDLDAGVGAGWIEGSGFPIAIPTVQRILCDGQVQLLLTGDDGEQLYLSRKARRFTAAQKRAITARDGGCAWPGCHNPAHSADVHHIDEWDAHHGGTDVPNGILLCRYHHHWLHAHPDRQIRMTGDVPYLVPATWTGAALPVHRMQQHPIATTKRMKHDGFSPPRRT